LPPEVEKLDRLVVDELFLEDAGLAAKKIQNLGKAIKKIKTNCICDLYNYENSYFPFMDE
jgi:hypothetical protein